MYVYHLYRICVCAHTITNPNVHTIISTSLDTSTTTIAPPTFYHKTLNLHHLLCVKSLLSFTSFRFLTSWPLQCYAKDINKVLLNVYIYIYIYQWTHHIHSAYTCTNVSHAHTRKHYKSYTSVSKYTKAS